MQATELKIGDRVKYISELGDNAAKSLDKYAEGVVDRIDTYDNGLVWVLVGEKGYERSRPFNPSWIVEVIKARANQPTQEQLDALISFAHDNGRRWKSELRDCWLNCNYGGRTDGHLLQQVRNQFGPSWLVKFSLPKQEAK